MAIIPIADYLLLKRLIEQVQDRRDVEEAERRLGDPAERPISYEEVCRQLGLADSSS